MLRSTVVLHCSGSVNMVSILCTGLNYCTLLEQNMFACLFGVCQVKNLKITGNTVVP